MPGDEHSVTSMFAILTECNIHDHNNSMQYSVNVSIMGSGLLVWQSKVDIEHQSVLCISSTIPSSKW